MVFAVWLGEPFSSDRRRPVAFVQPLLQCVFQIGSVQVQLYFKRLAVSNVLVVRVQEKGCRRLASVRTVPGATSPAQLECRGVVKATLWHRTNSSLL